MSDTESAQSKSRLLPSVIILLFIVVGILSWRLLQMEQQLSKVDGDATGVIPAEDKQSGNDGANAGPADQSNPNIDPWSQGPYDPWASDPFEEIRRMQEQMDRIFDQRFGQLHQWPTNRRSIDRPPAKKRPDFEYRTRQHFSSPKLDVQEDENQYRVFVNLPGTDEDNIAVTLDGQRLTVKARQRYEKHDRDSSGNFEYREQSSGSFQRSIILREPVIENAMRTRLNKGVLEIMIPKAR